MPSPECHVCTRPFVPKSARSRFCSDRCLQKHKRRMRPWVKAAQNKRYKAKRQTVPARPAEARQLRSVQRAKPGPRPKPTAQRLAVRRRAALDALTETLTTQEYVFLVKRKPWPVCSLALPIYLPAGIADAIRMAIPVAGRKVRRTKQRTKGRDRAAWDLRNQAKRHDERRQKRRLRSWRLAESARSRRHKLKYPELVREQVRASAHRRKIRELAALDVAQDLRLIPEETV